ncbi:MAG: homoserine dehydrogenase [bacterium]
MKQINLGLIGWGTVGVGVTKILEQCSASLSERLGAEIVLRRIADLDITTPRDVRIPADRLTKDANEILDDPEIHIVIELIGGIEPARSFILKAIDQGKQVITANKALLAQHGAEIFERARTKGVDIGFEASVGGGIPIIRAITEGFVSNRIHAIYGIINGTANFILTRMFEEKRDFDEVLAEAQQLGYAEADPTYDIKGLDTAHKLAILSALAFGKGIQLKEIYTEGIDRITLLDLTFAAELGYRIKLLALAKNDEDGLEVRVHPTMIPEDNMLASVDGVYNAIYLIGGYTGPTMFYGQGAGQLPTANAVLSDVMEIARDVLYSTPGRVTPTIHHALKSKDKHLQDIRNIRSEYYLRVSAMDRPGVLSAISGILGEHNISIASVIQKGRGEKGGVPIIMMTHEALESDLQNALAEIDRLPMVLDSTLCIRMESLPS